MEPKEFIKEADDFTLSILNQILRNKTLSYEDKENIFEIIVTLHSQKYRYSELYENTLQSFSNFCINNHKFNLEELSIFLENMVNRINNMENETSFKTDGSNKNFQLLIPKFQTILTCFESFYSSFDFEEYLPILDKILQSKCSENTYKTIHWLLSECNSDTLYNPAKLKIFLETCIDEKFSTKHIDNYEFLLPHLHSIFSDNSLLSLDENTFKKLVELSMTNTNAYILDTLLCKSNKLSLEKRKAVINYYYHILNKQLPNFSTFNAKEIDNEINKRPLLNVITSNRLLSMSDEEYENYLECTKLCINPTSFAKIITSENIVDEEKRNVALSLVNQSVPFISYKDFSKYKSKDFKEPIANAAIAPIMKHIPQKDYQSLLNIINFYCLNAERNYLLDNMTAYNNYMNIANTIANILHNTSLNLNKLLFSVQQITSINFNRLNALNKFCSNSNIKEYTDEEYKKILQLITTSDNWYLLADLFTNENIPFINNKEELFEIAQKEEEIIKAYIKEQYNLGTLNKGMSTLFNGVDEKTQKSITKFC